MTGQQKCSSLPDCLVRAFVADVLKSLLSVSPDRVLTAVQSSLWARQLWTRWNTTGCSFLSLTSPHLLLYPPLSSTALFSSSLHRSKAHQSDPFPSCAALCTCQTRRRFSRSFWLGTMHLHFWPWFCSICVVLPLVLWTHTRIRPQALVELTQSHRGPTIIPFSPSLCLSWLYHCSLCAHWLCCVFALQPAPAPSLPRCAVPCPRLTAFCSCGCYGTVNQLFKQ